jgi:HAD superfamily hydrolase (TIGR01509 family)
LSLPNGRAGRKICALVFDFDGLILDTEGPIYQSWLELYQAYGGSLPLSFWIGTIGTAETDVDLFDMLEGQIGRRVDRERLDPARWDREAELILTQSIRPGVLDYLEGARRRGLKTGLASSSSCEWVTGHLARLNLLSYFDCIRASNDVPRTKPDPALYLEVLGCLQVPAGQAVAFEDSPNGVQAAKRAGLYCVAVPNDITRHFSLEPADLQLGSLADLPLDELLASLNHAGTA